MYHTMKSLVVALGSIDSFQAQGSGAGAGAGGCGGVGDDGANTSKAPTNTYQPSPPHLPLLDKDQIVLPRRPSVGVAVGAVEVVIASVSVYAGVLGVLCSFALRLQS